MINKRLTVFLTIIIPILAVASESHLSREDFKVIHTESLNAMKVEQDTHLVIGKGGHLEESPYRVEVRANCQEQDRGWDQANVVRIKSVCGVLLDSIKKVERKTPSR